MSDYEPWTVFDSGHPVAAKEHRCDECRRKIARGERYLYGRGLSCGYWSTVRMCAHCEEAVRWLQKAYGECGFGTVAEDLYEAFRDDESCMSLGRIIAHMRRKWAGVAPSDVRALVDADFPADGG